MLCSPHPSPGLIGRVQHLHTACASIALGCRGVGAPAAESTWGAGNARKQARRHALVLGLPDRDPEQDPAAL